MRRLTGLVTLIAIVAIAVPAVAQTIVSASNPTFSWTGKTGQQANYSWSTTVTNPGRRDAEISVSVQLLDESGAVVSSDTKMATVGKRSEVSVSGDANLPFADARRSSTYRIVVEGVEN